ncbi:hypothetical protein T10_9851, partial [Trichinella papuae]
LEAARFFINISGNKQLGAVELPNFGSQSFSRNFRNFVNYRLACFAKNGQKSFTGNSPVVVG